MVDDEPIVLIGMMGAGKSAVGRLVAQQLARPFVDGDAAVEARAGCSVPQLFAQRGEDGFRAVEAEVLDELLDRRPPVVLAAGGGVVVLPANRRALHDRAQVVWLRAPVDELLERVGDGSGRPLLAGDPAGALSELEARRSPWYAEAAHVTIDTARRPAPQVAAEVVRRLAPLAPAPKRRS